MERGIRIIERLKNRPEGYPAIGDTFEFEFRGAYENTVTTHVVTGWERQEREGHEEISVRCWPIHSRVRRLEAWRTCEMGYWHPVLSGEPAKPGAPHIWGSCGKNDDPRLVGLDYDPDAKVPTVFPYSQNPT